MIDRLRAWIGEMSATHAVDHDPEVKLLSCRAIAADPDLYALMFQHFNRVHVAMAEAVAAETGTTPDSVGPQMFAAAAVAMFEILQRIAAEGSDDARRSSSAASRAPGHARHAQVMT